MKYFTHILAGITLAGSMAHGQHLNILRQIQLDFENPNPDEYVVWDIQVPDTGQSFSGLAIDPGGARFELWTFLNDTLLSSHMLDMKFVGENTPVAEMLILTDDPYELIPRTRADRPFDVYIRPGELLLDDPDAPDAHKAVRLQRRVQSYGPDGTGENIDRKQSSLFQEVLLTEEQVYHYTFDQSEIPGSELSDVRGEETFTVYSLPDYQVESQQLASIIVQVWPTEVASISGISEGESLRFNTPPITLSYQNTYPGSNTYAELIYGPLDGTAQGTRIIGSQWLNTSPASESKVFPLSDWDTAIDRDGEWTMIIVTETPFGEIPFGGDTGREILDYVTFNVKRSIEVQGSVTTSE